MINILITGGAGHIGASLANKLSEKAKDSLFRNAPFGKQFQKDLQQVLNISDNIRASGKTFANPSGTADRLVGQGLIFGGGAKD